jgi:nucleotide-binding universal stress UspA family protein
LFAKIKEVPQEVLAMKVLVPVDKGAESQLALRYACHLLENREDADLDALYVKPDLVEMAPESVYAPFHSAAGLEKTLNADAARVGQQIRSVCNEYVSGKLECEPIMAVGDPADEILHAAQTGDYDLIVLGSHGRSSLRGFLLGTVHAKILHHARQPVLIVRDFRPIQRVLIAYRGSQCDQGALRFVSPLLANRNFDITILHVQETERGETEELAQACLLQGDETLKQLGHTPKTKMAKGDFVDEILKDVVVERYDLIVLGAYGHKRPKYLKVISDEALNLVRWTTRPVLVYRDKNEQ